MRVQECIVEVLREIIYWVVMSIYLFILNRFNKELLSHNFGNSFELLKYKDYAAFKFFAVAVILFLIGCILIYFRFQYIKREASLFEEILVSVLALIITFIVLIMLIVLIDNPILRAVLTFSLVICGLASNEK